MSCKIVVYTSRSCIYCQKAKDLLDKKGVQYTTIDITNNQDLLEQMLQKSGGRKSVPQIFIGEKHIGGFDDLNLLNTNDQLDKLLLQK